MEAILNYISSGGVVMVPLIAVSTVMWAFIIERLIFFKRLYQNSLNKKDAMRYIKEGKIPEKGGITAIFIREFLKRKVNRKELDLAVLEEVSIAISSLLDKYIPLIKTLSVIAPLLGLLGTVIGMIKTFDVISIFGTGNAKAMARSISEALITTQTGLIVAIPGLYMSRFLERRSEQIKHKIKSTAIFIKRHMQ